jgi:hypothetical protein
MHNRAERRAIQNGRAFSDNRRYYEKDKEEVIKKANIYGDNLDFDWDEGFWIAFEEQSSYLDYLTWQGM